MPVSKRDAQGRDPLRRLGAMKLQEIRLHRAQDRRDLLISRIGHQRHQSHASAQMLGQRAGEIQREVPARFRMKDQTAKIRARAHRGVAAFHTVDTADFDQNAHGTRLIARLAATGNPRGTRAATETPQPPTEPSSALFVSKQGME